MPMLLNNVMFIFHHRSIAKPRRSLLLRFIEWIITAIQYIDN